MDLKIYRKSLAYPYGFLFFVISISDVDFFVDMGQNEKNSVTELIRILNYHFCLSLYCIQL